jgi:hypothetical protein
VVSSYRERFGEDLSRPSIAADPGMLGLGAIDEDDPLPRTSRHRCPAPAHRVDEEYFADRGYLS